MFSIKRAEIIEKKDTVAVSAIPLKEIATGSRLADLSLIIDTGGVYQGEETKLDLSFSNYKDNT